MNVKQRCALQASFTALLDEMASPLYEDAIADDRHQPCSIALMLAIAVRIACNPARWGLAATQGDDAYSTKMVTLLLDAVQPSVLSGLYECRTGEQTYAIDVVITHACQSMMGVIRKLESGTGKANGARLGIESAKVEATYRNTMHHLFCAGVAVCGDVCGLPSKQVNERAAHSKEPTWYTDATTESMSQSAYSAGLGAVTERYPRHRTTTRGKRQTALICLLQNVENWICTGKYQVLLGIVIDAS